LDQLDRISDIELAEDAVGAAALPTPEELNRESILAPIFSPAPRADISVDARYGDLMPFGVVGRVCDARNKPLGRRIEKSGPGGYALFDSDPGSTVPHTFYLTGFSDGCPRQFTAAVALLGAPSMHEQLRYGLPGEIHPYSSTDKAYETVKARVCGARRGKPCGAAIKRLERSTVFVSAYERYGAAPRWTDMLVHDGAVLAKAVKTAP
jgi:hypothetical protein